MFESMKAIAGDPIIQLMGQYKVDPRADKIDVGVGVFKTVDGQTPIMKAVKVAEQTLYNNQTTKTYVGIDGDKVFDNAMAEMVFADSIDRNRVRAIQATGGSGALRICADMLHNKSPHSTVWVSDPTWGNHTPIFEAAGFTVKKYAYLNSETKMVDEEAFLSAIAKFGRDDIVLFHGCCHNPTGSDISPSCWDKVAQIASEKGFLPFIDIAYQGFGKGLDEDLYGTRKLAASVDDMVVTSSCSKNFGLYRDRVGCAMIMAKDSDTADVAKSHLSVAARVAYSMPPDHGAALVALIMTTPELRSVWEEELTEMRNRILSMRKQLSDTLRDVTGTNNWDFITEHRGMFSLLCLDKNQTDTLVNDHSIYIVNGGRINIAGLQGSEQITRFAECLAEVTK